MFWAGEILKLGVPATGGFLLGLVAIAVVQPVTIEGKLLLLGTAICFTIVVLAAGGLLVRAIRRPRAGEKDG